MGNILAVGEEFRPFPSLVIKERVTRPNVSVTYFGESLLSITGDNLTHFSSFLNPIQNTTRGWSELEPNLSAQFFYQRDYYQSPSTLYPYTVLQSTPLTLLSFGLDNLHGWFMTFAEWNNPLFAGFTGEQRIIQ